MIAKGRAEFLQKEIIKAIYRLDGIDDLSLYKKSIFGKLLKDPVIKEQVEKLIKERKERDAGQYRIF